ncbi:hypothetical protein THOB06_100046 [Vibrio rotiferianus]|nr:hypothetical protein THOG10_100046 [Vibrio rotiferianus]CAH1559677.1 hypothetical protein THOB06_100046 [Vibrio rotiferianus]
MCSFGFVGDVVTKSLTKEMVKRATMKSPASYAGLCVIDLSLTD